MAQSVESMVGKLMSFRNGIHGEFFHDVANKLIELEKEKAPEPATLELDEQTRWILGRPNFTCASFANSLRKLGHKINDKAEDEQAAVIHWMLCLYHKHGEGWRTEGEEILKSV